MKIVSINHQGRTKSTTLRLFVAGFGQDAQALAEILRNEELESASLPDIYLTAEYADNIANAIAEHGSRCNEFEQDLLDLSELEDLISGYESVEILAWSFGVRVARAMADKSEMLRSKLVAAIALNGTVLSVDDSFGIPERSYNTTYRRFSAPVYASFTDNMCLNSTQDKFDLINAISARQSSATAIYFFGEEDPDASSRSILKDAIAQRDIDVLKHELRFMPFIKLNPAQDTAIEPSAPSPNSTADVSAPTQNSTADVSAPSQDHAVEASMRFTAAIVGIGDVIIPPANQMAYWSAYEGYCASADFKTFYVEVPHFCPRLMRVILSRAKLSVDDILEAMI